jgi:hypothetical protein
VLRVLKDVTQRLLYYHLRPHPRQPSCCNLSVLWQPRRSLKYPGSLPDL